MKTSCEREEKRNNVLTTMSDSAMCAQKSRSVGWSNSARIVHVAGDALNLRWDAWVRLEIRGHFQHERNTNTLPHLDLR